MDEREIELAGFHVVAGNEQQNWDAVLEWGQAVSWREGEWWRGEEEYPVAPCRTIEVTDEIRAADAQARAQREAQRKASITWVSPVAARKQEQTGGTEAGEREPKRPAVYLFPSARVHSNRREVA